VERERERWAVSGVAMEASVAPGSLAMFTERPSSFASLSAALEYCCAVSEVEVVAGGKMFKNGQV